MTDERPAKDRMIDYFTRTGALGNAAPLNYKTFTKIIEAFIDPTAIIKKNTTVWHYARVLANVTIGEDCSVGGGAEIGRGTTIGDRTRISSGVFLPSNSVIGNDVFIGPNVTITDDRHPKVLKPGETYKAEPPVIEDHVSIGAGAVILPGINIGHHAFVAAGSIVTKDVPAHGTVRSEPARPFTLSTNARDAFGVRA